MRKPYRLTVLASAILALSFQPALAADCGPWTDLRSPGFSPRAATVGALTTMVTPVGGPPLSQGDRVIVTSAPDETFSCFVRIGRNNTSNPGTILTSLLAFDAERGSDWLGHWQSGAEQFITIEQAGNQLEISGEATWGMFDPERVARGGVNVGDFSATARPKKGALSFTAGDGGNTLPYASDSDSCSIRMWLAGEFLVALDNNLCGGMNVTFTGFYARKATR